MLNGAVLYGPEENRELQALKHELGVEVKSLEQSLEHCKIPLDAEFHDRENLKKIEILFVIFGI